MSRRKDGRRNCGIANEVHSEDYARMRLDWQAERFISRAAGSRSAFRGSFHTSVRKRKSGHEGSRIMELECHYIPVPWRRLDLVSAVGCRAMVQRNSTDCSDHRVRIMAGQ